MPEPKHIIIVEVSPDGDITSRVIGVNGPSCSSLTAWLDELGKVTRDVNTPDYYKPAQQGITNTVKG